MLEIRHDLSLPEDELRFSVSRGGGPGGQHVNKVATRVTLRFDVAGSPTLTDSQRARLSRRLASRLTSAGELVMHAGRQRSQSANRRELTERFVELLREALAPRRRRRPTRPGAGAVERRLKEKRARARTKDARRRPSGDD